MKKLLLTLLLFLVVIPSVTADNYTSLWKQVGDAESKDLPQSEMSVLKMIIAQAKAEHKYGQLLCAELKNAGVQISVSPDSLQSVVGVLIGQEQQAEKTNKVLAAVYQSVLGRIYKDNRDLGADHAKVSRDYFMKSIANPALLAVHKDAEYVPLVNVGYDSRIFDNDLLSILCYEAGDFRTAHDYYVKKGNRTAAMMTALEMARGGDKRRKARLDKSTYAVTLDSLISIYGDLSACGELAIERYNYMSGCDDVTAEDKINYIHKALERWGGWPRMNELRNAEKELTQPMFGASLGQMVSLPNSQRVVRFDRIRNINEITMTVSRLVINADNHLNMNDDADYANVKKMVAEPNIISQTKRYTGQPAYKILTDSMVIGGLPTGAYLVEVNTDNRSIGTQRCLYYVSDMFVVREELPGSRLRFVAVSATSGQPIEGARIRLTFGGMYGQKDKVVDLTCDKKGEVVYTYNQRQEQNSNIFVYTDNDKYYPETSIWGGFNYYDVRTDADYVNLYTDRSIYRPGQTVHVAAVVFNNKKGIETQAEKGIGIKLTLRDANYKVVGEKSVTTDEYGTASTDFTLPQTGLTGRYSVQCDFGSRGSVGFRVEEYKRPTFEIIFPKVNTKYQNGGTLVVTAYAKSYAGIPVQGAKVTYKVSRRQALWWWRYGDGRGEDTMNEGAAVTDDKGAFRIEIPMVLPDGVGEGAKTRYPIARFYNFTAEATVTDVGGESHSGEMSVPLGSRPAAFGCDIPGKIERDSLRSVSFVYKNQAGIDIDGDVTYYIDNFKTRYMAKTNQATPLKLNAAMLASGEHRLLAVCENDTLDKKFIVFGMSDTRPCVKTDNWFYQTATSFDRDGRPVYVQVGSSADSVHVMYSVIAGRRVIDDGVMDQSNAISTHAYKYKEEYGTGLLINYAWVKDGRLYEHSTTIQRPMPDKRLMLKWTTFRDRLVPGQKEEWTLHIARPDGKAASAQLMAVMYDKSLDQIAKHTWSFDPRLYQNLPSGGWRCGQVGSNSLDGSAAMKYLTVKDLTFSKFDDSYFDMQTGYGGMFPNRFMGTRAMARLESMADGDMAVMAMAKTANVAAAAPRTIAGAVSGTAEPKAETEEHKQTATGQVRENFNETAFFYPALSSDGSGNVSIRFTLPESITTWRLMAMAHDTQMNYGMLTDEAVAKKTVMVQPNMPRFVREGDMASVGTKIFNTSENKVDGTARIQLIDPASEKVVYTQSKTFSVETEQTVGVNFDLPASALRNADIYICRITADGKGFSDGEQHYLPILPDKEMVTRTVPFTQNGPGTKTVDLTRLFPVKDKKNRLTVEYTNNPAWLMIQTLPSIVPTGDESAIGLSTAYYTNTIGRMIMAQSPKIKSAVEMWKQEKGDENSMMSSLQKNQELKDLVLNETPWVADANQETSQKQLLSTFFDESAMQYRIETSAGKLRKLQNPDGSWSWWPGMEGSVYMTGDVMKTLVRLNTMTGKQEATANMLDKAFGYMGRQVVKIVEEMKKDEKKGHVQNYVGGTELDFLYTCALDGRQLPAQVKGANDYLLNILQKMTRGQSLYDKAMTAIILAKNGKTAKSREYVQSLKEYTVYTEEMGRYYDAPKAGYSWCDYRIPTEVAAIEALKCVTPNDVQTIEEMQRWLLQEKRTQCWDTPVNSVNAVYAFLKGNMSVLAAQEKTVLTLNGKRMDTPKETAGLGYVKVAETGDDMHTFSAQKTSTGTSWGAVYAQFMQKSTDVENTASGISVKREIIGNSMKVGDKVKVRITIKAERDYDFVQVSDRRAACMEPVNQLSGYHWGYYCAPKDCTTNYYFDCMRKGTHTIETEYYIDRSGEYTTGTCTVQCAYSPEYKATVKGMKMTIKN